MVMGDKKRFKTHILVGDLYAVKRNAITCGHSLGGSAHFNGRGS